MKKTILFFSGMVTLLFGFGVLWPSAAPYVYQAGAALGALNYQQLRVWQQMGGLPGEDVVNETYLKILCPEAERDADDLSLEPVSRSNPLPLEYVPPFLVQLTEVRTIGIQCATSDTAKALKKLFAAAKRDDIEIAVASGYRRPEMQQLTYEMWRSIEGDEKTEKSVAKPGHSEHQTGTAVDFSGASQNFSVARDDFGASPEGVWLARHAHKYGFTMSYLKDDVEYAHEPWHFRFVGESMARLLHDKDLSYNEYHLFAPPGATSSVDRILYDNPRLF